MRALKELRENSDIIVLSADKGNATVVMNTSDYNSKISNILKDPAYKPHPNDPTTYLEKTTKSKIVASSINDDTKKSLIPREKSSCCPKLYGLPKIHKDGAPLRPIVSSINSPTYKLAQFLAKILQPTAERCASYVRNSQHFIERVKDIVLDPTDLLISFDVTSLFTMIPISEAIESIKKEMNPSSDILDLIQHCLNNTYFSFNGNIYKQVQGAPMGSPISPAVANIFMSDLEKRALDSAPLKPKLWLRYIDDTFIIWNHGREKLKLFLDHLNSVSESIKFTMEVEESNSLPFLDVLVKKNPNGHMSFDVYRKKTHTDRYLHAASHHPPAQLSGVVNTLTHRSKAISDDQHRPVEMARLRKALQSNGYSDSIIKKAFASRERRRTSDETAKSQTRSFVKLPYIRGTTDRVGRLLQRHNIKVVFSPHRKTGSMLRNIKDYIPNESQGIYEIPCLGCPGVYLGKTNRRISARVAEHRVDVKGKKPSSTLAMHSMTEGHSIDFDNARTVTKLQNETSRVYREAIEIFKRDHSLNTRDDSKRLPFAWQTIISKHPPPQPPSSLQNVPPTRIQHATSDITPTVRRSTRLAALAAAVNRSS